MAIACPKTCSFHSQDTEQPKWFGTNGSIYAWRTSFDTFIIVVGATNETVRLSVCSLAHLFSLVFGLVRLVCSEGFSERLIPVQCQPFRRTHCPNTCANSLSMVPKSTLCSRHSSNSSFIPPKVARGARKGVTPNYS